MEPLDPEAGPQAGRTTLGVCIACNQRSTALWPNRWSCLRLKNRRDQSLDIVNYVLVAADFKLNRAIHSAGSSDDRDTSGQVIAVLSCDHLDQVILHLWHGESSFTRCSCG